LIERAGFHRGLADGAVGLSTRHVLAVINRGGACAADVVRLAARVRRGVREAFGVVLEPEPFFAGFGAPSTEVLDTAP
jgi:UDP-N-acetylmuramate dehydrogenase